MASQQEARLNLVLSAQDNASAVIKKVANSVKSAFDSIQKIMNESLNLSGLENLGATIASKLENEMQNAARTVETSVAQAAESACTALVPIGETAVTVTQTMQRAGESASRALVPIEQTALTVAQNTENSFRNAGNVIDAEYKVIGETIQADVQKAANGVKGTLSELQTEAAAISKKTSFFDTAGLMLAGQQIEMAGRKVLGFFVDAAKSAISFDQDIHNVVASLVAMGDTTMKPEQAFDALKKKALDLGMTGFFSANQIAQAMNTMAQQGITSQQILNGAIDTVANVAAANQQDLEHTANVISDIIHQMGSELKDEFGKNFKDQMEGVGNAITKALHNGRMSMDDFLAVMRYAGPQAAELGIKFKDLAGSIAELARHGIKGSQAGTTLRRMFTNLIPQTAAARREMEQLGFITKDGGNIFLDTAGKIKPLAEVQRLLHERIAKLPPAMQQMAIKTIFGQYALSGMMAIVDEAPDQFRALVNSMGDTNAMMDALKEKEQGLGFMVQQLQAHFDTFKKEVGDYLKPVLIMLIGAVEGLLKVWQEIPGPIKETIVIFSAVASAVATAIGGFLVFKATLELIPRALGPWGLLISGIITGVALLISHWKDIEKWVNNIFGINLPAVWKQCQKAFSDAWKGITKAFGDVWKEIQKIFDATWKKIQPDVIAGVKEVRKWWGDAWHTIQTTFSHVWSLIKHVVDSTWKKIKPDIIAGAKEVAKFWNQEWPTVKKTFSDVWNAIKKIFGDTLKNMEPQMISGVREMQKSWNQAWPTIKKVFSDAWTVMKKVFDTVFKKIIPDIITGVKEAHKTWMQTWPIVQKTFSDVWKAMGKLFQDVWSKVGPAIIAGVKEVAKWWNQEWPTIKKIFEEVWNSLLKTFQDIWKNIGPQIISGIKEVQKYWDEIWPEIKELFSEVWTVIKTILTVSLDFVLKNWTNIWNLVKSTFKGVWDGIVGTFKTVWDLFSGLFLVALDILTGHWSKAWDDMWNMLKNVCNDITNTLGNLINDALDWGKNLVKMLADGIEWGIGWVEKAVSKVADKISSFLGFHSPTKEGPAHDSDKWMPNMVKMFTDTLEESRPGFQKELFKVAMDIQSHLNVNAANRNHNLPTVQHILNPITRHLMSIGRLFNSKRVIERADPFLEAESRTAYDRIAGHTRNVPHTTSLYDRYAGHGAHHVTVNIQIEGRSKETDRQLLQQMQDHLGRVFRTHIPMRIG